MNEKNRKRELIFWGTGFLLLLGIALFLFYSITFVVENAKKIIGDDITGGAQITRFNLDGVEKLGLTEQNQ